MLLVTGATGFIGCAVVSELLNGGAKVICAVRKKTTQFPAGAQLIEVGDLSVETDWINALQGIDVVIHTAARAHVLNENSPDPLAEFRKINKDATLELARQAMDAGVKRFIFISSIGVNGNNNTVPFVEDAPPNAQEPYAISKYEAEMELLKLADKTTMEVVIIRPPLVYGPGAPGNFGSLVEWINKGTPLPLGSVHNQRSLVALENLVSFIIHCANYKKTTQAANQVFLISDDEDVSTTELLRKMAKAFGKRPLLLPVPVWLMIFAANLIGKGAVAKRLFGTLLIDSSKARELLGWKPVITMDVQLAKMAKVYFEKQTLCKTQHFSS